MSRIIFQKSYLILLPSYQMTHPHKHPFLHLFFSKKGCRICFDDTTLKGNIILLDSNVPHMTKEENGCDFILLIDPTSSIAESLRKQYLKEDIYNIFSRLPDIYDKPNKMSDDEIVDLIERLLLNMEIISSENDNKDKRVETIITNILSGKWLSYSVEQIAASTFLSESRLSHLFKADAKISLKSYLLMRRLEHAYRLVCSGKTITYAACESGFASPSHLAYTCQKLTGIAISEVFNKKIADF